MSAASSEPTSATPFATIEAAIEDFRNGKMVVIVDSEDRENEGDVCVASEFVTDEHITFMAVHARGLICMTMAPDRIDQLGLQLQAPNNGTTFETAFTVSIEAAEGVTTGISAADRAHTIRVAAKPDATPRDLVSPGHVFPLRARPHGVLERTGQTEGSVDLAKLAGLQPSAVICEVMNDDGTMARVPDLVEFCKIHNLNMISITDMIEYRRRTESHVERRGMAKLPTRRGEFHTFGYESTVDGAEHLALVVGDVKGASDVLVRVHSSCVTGDVFGSLRCDCGDQLDHAMDEIQAAGCGVLIYMQQEGRGIGLLDKLRAYELQEQGRDTVEANEDLGYAADLREYHLAAHMLQDLGVKSVRLLTNNPMKLDQMQLFGMPVSERVASETGPRVENRTYLRTKRDKLGHLLSHLENGTIAGGIVGAAAQRDAEKAFAHQS